MNWFISIFTTVLLVLGLSCQESTNNSQSKNDPSVMEDSMALPTSIQAPPKSIDGFYDRMTTSPDQRQEPIAFVVKQFVDKVVKTERGVNDFSYLSELQDSSLLFMMNIPTLSFLAPEKRHHTVSLVERGLSNVPMLQNKSVHILILENLEPKFLKTPEHQMDTTNLDLSVLNHFIDTK